MNRQFIWFAVMIFPFVMYPAYRIRVRLFVAKARQLTRSFIRFASRCWRPGTPDPTPAKRLTNNDGNCPCFIPFQGCEVGALNCHRCWISDISGVGEARDARCRYPAVPGWSLTRHLSPWRASIDLRVERGMFQSAPMIGRIKPCRLRSPATLSALAL